MWTDVFQIIMMMVGLLASLIKGVMDNGGINNVIETSWKGSRIELLKYFDPMKSVSN
jgi:Na+/pantothenate symporter